MHADSRDFAPFHPHSRQLGDAAGGDSKLSQSVDDHLFDGAHVTDHVTLPFAQIEDWVADQLPGAVVGDVASAVGRVKGNAGTPQDFFAGQQVLHAPVTPQRDHMRVLEQQKLVANLSLLALASEVLLQLERLRVIDAPEFPQLAATH